MSKIKKPRFTWSSIDQAGYITLIQKRSKVLHSKVIEGQNSFIIADFNKNNEIIGVEILRLKNK